MKRISFALLAGTVALGGCKRSTPAAAPTPTAHAIPTHAQPRLQSVKLWIGAEEMNTEVALTEDQIETGMMFRTNMAENEGMLFVFSQPWRVSFWMMNTVLPLSAAYIGPDGTIVEIHDLQPHDTNLVTAASSSVQYVLETPQGWFKRHHVETNTVIASEKGSLRNLFDFHKR